MITVNPYINKKLGYYVCDNIEFGSKIQACFHAVKVQKPIQWVFNNDVFSSYNWKEEPEFTLDYYYDLRARQLREQYDYVILSYSGGADSHNIYESFRRQNLHIDEILVNSMESASQKILNDNSKTSVNAPLSEHRQHTIPRLREIAAQSPKTKITIVDLSSEVFQNFERIGDASWVLEKREGLNPIGITRFNYLTLSEIRKKFDKSRRICIIIGCEKPKTVIHQKKIYMKFTDRAANINTVADHYRHYTNTTVEFFYWSPDCVPLLIKQGHVIKKYLETNPDMQVYWMMNLNRTKSSENFRLFQEPLLRSLIYTTWRSEWFQADKAISDWYSEFDQWFQLGYSDTKAFHIWKEGIKYVEDNLTPFLRPTTSERFDGFQDSRRHYELGEMKNLHSNFSTWLY